MGSVARNDGSQHSQFMRKTVNFGDGGIATGVKLGTLPKGAFITGCDVEVITAFNAGTTNVLTVGTLATGNEIVAAADVTEGTPGNYTMATLAKGRSFAAAADVDVYIRYTQTGTAGTTGQANVVLTYAPNNDGA